MVIIFLGYNMLKISLYEKLGKDLGQKYKIDNLFDELADNSTKVIMDFSDIEFISRSFAQGYLNHKFHADYEIEEINLPDVVKNMFNVVLKNNNYDMRY